MDSNKYNNYNDAYSECNKTITGTVTNNTYYKCSFYDTEYSSYSDAVNNCVKVVPGTITSEPHTTTDTCPVYGSKDLKYICASTGKWALNTWSATDYGCTPCGSGYSKKGYHCDPPSIQGGSCSKGSTTSETVSCYNTCSKTYVDYYNYYCSLGWYVSSYNSDCSETKTGTVSQFTRYYCSLTNSYYSTESEANNNCVKEQTGSVSDKTLFKCPLDNKEYNSLNEAENACTNYCELGKFYSNDNSCYSLEKR